MVSRSTFASAVTRCGPPRDECGTRGCGAGCQAHMTGAFAVTRKPCLHLDQGGDGTPDRAIPLVVPTGFEPVSPP